MSKVKSGLSRIQLYVPFFIILFSGAVLFILYGRSVWQPVWIKIIGKKTVQDVYNEIGEKIEKRLQVSFSKAGVKYPPQKVALIAYKREKLLELYAYRESRFVKIKEFQILGASGKEGPKLRNGDRQVPEGLYNIIGLNPNSSFHLSLKLDYPNSFDKRMADIDHRNDPGGDIFIHGKTNSIGCLAMGDDAIEELFILVFRTGKENVKVIISPNKRTESSKNDKVLWKNELYSNIKKELKIIKSG